MIGLYLNNDNTHAIKMLHKMLNKMVAGGEISLKWL